MITPGSLVKGARSVYRVERKLAEGGMGIVWIAHDLASDEEVVVKTPKPIPVAVSKSRFEAELLRRLRHPHIVRYIDESRMGNATILVEELVRGRSIYDIVSREGPLSPKKAEAILSAVLLALDMMHSMNIIHRDIKPRNIMVGDTVFDTKIIDMGTAVYYQVSGLGEQVYSGGGYTAPEQFMGYAFPQSDIWSVMATAFYMVTGVDPITVMQGYYPRVKPPATPDPRIYNPSVPDRLARVIIKGMQWHVLDRFSSAREALDTLTGIAMARKYPVLEVLGIVVPIKTSRLVFGRKDSLQKDVGTTIGRTAEGQILGLEEERKVEWTREGDITYVRVSDPYRWISRYHFEILYLNGTWCIRDLGSTNRTAIMTKRGIIEIWAGRSVVSPCYPLEPRTLILVAYGSSLQRPPYVTAYFRMPGY